jgi:hypothetical protein
VAATIAVLPSRSTNTVPSAVTASSRAADAPVRRESPYASIAAAISAAFAASASPTVAAFGRPSASRITAATTSSETSSSSARA